MRCFIPPFVGLLMIVQVGAGQESPAPPGHPPQLWLASASRQDGKVVIQIARARPKASNPKVHSAADVIVWDNLRKVTLGETVRAYGVDGEPLEAKAVLNKLANPRGVAVFVRIYQFDPPEPPRFYLELLRKGTIVFVVDGGDVYDLAP